MQNMDETNNIAELHKLVLPAVVNSHGARLAGHVVMAGAGGTDCPPPAHSLPQLTS